MQSLHAPYASSNYGGELKIVPYWGGLCTTDPEVYSTSKGQPEPASAPEHTYLTVTSILPLK